MPERLDELWYADGEYERRETTPIAHVLAAVHEAAGSDAGVEEVVAWRLELARRSLVPIPGALTTLDELRSRGLRLGLISNCTEDVPLVWDETPFAGLFDATAFSATEGCMKPDRRIYERLLDQLGVPAEAALFVGDGANDELEGARRVGMTPVLIDHDGVGPRWESLEGWGGAHITSIAQVLELVGPRR